MSNSPHPHSFQPQPPDPAGVVSWVHVGDLHMRSTGEQNARDLRAIVAEVNQAFSGSVSFVFLPGDNADHGDLPAYQVVRDALDQLQVPWCAIIGDHDVEQKSFRNFKTFMAPDTHYAFTVGKIRFVALNAFDVPEPPSFTVSEEQLSWLEEQLLDADRKDREKVLFLHCYPSDLKQGRDGLARLVSKHKVKLIDMGHTHYNEIAHDGSTIYTATRSTGQIEEGPVGFSVTNIDGEVVSWRFLELGKLPAVIITSPADERLLADDATSDSSSRKQLLVRAKVWGRAAIRTVKATIQDMTVSMQLIPETRVWEGTLQIDQLEPGTHALQVIAMDADGQVTTDQIRALIGEHRRANKRAERDQDNALGAWPEHGLLGTQLGPNKNGRKW